MDVELIKSAYEAWNESDVERLVELTHPDVEITPLVMGVTSTGPWQGHDGLRKLVDEARGRWAVFEIDCEDVLVFGDRVVALVRIKIAVHASAPTITGDIAHVIEFDGKLVRRIVAYRDRAEAVAAAESEPE